MKMIVMGLLVTQFAFSQEHIQEDEYQTWLGFHQLKSEDFQLVVLEEDLELIWEDYRLDSATTDLYGQFFIYSPDGSRYLDFDTHSLALEEDDGKLYSEGFDVDMAVRLVNPSTRKYSTLLMCGPSCIPETGYWLSENILELAGFEYDADQYAVPTRYRYNLKEHTFSKYQIRECRLDTVKDYTTRVRLKTVEFKY